MTKLTLMTLNVGINKKYEPTFTKEEKKDKITKEDKKREFIRDQIIARINPKPDVLFLQEANKPDVDEILKYLGSINEYKSFLVKIEDGYNPPCIIIREAIKLKEIQFEKILLDCRTRLVLLRVILTEPPNQICYFASWHGPHNGYSNDKGRETAKRLITYVRRKCQGHPFIIGGDFNLDANEFRVAVSDVKVICDTGIVKNGRIDYFVLGDCSTEGISNSSPDNRLKHILSSTSSTCSFDGNYENGMVEKTTVDHISYYVIKNPECTVNGVLNNHPDIKTDRFFLLGNDECAYNRLTTTIPENAVRESYDKNAYDGEHAPLDHEPITLSLPTFKSEIYTASYSFGNQSYAVKLFSRFQNVIRSIIKYDETQTEDNSTNSTPDSIENPTENSQDQDNEVADIITPLAELDLKKGM